MKLLIYILFLLFYVQVTLLASVSVTPASGGTDLVRSTSSANGDPGGYATLGNIVITENANDDFSESGTLILNAPFNWQFNTAISPTITVATVTPANQTNITASFSGITSTAITFNITVLRTTRSDVVTISGIQVQAIDGNLTGATGNITPSGTATIAGLIITTNMGSLSLDASTPLPVELTSFSAVMKENSVSLLWKTETEVNNYGFEVQRSTEDEQWDKIGFVNGNGNSINEYKFDDNNLKYTGKYSYRLKQIDNDGSFEYSNVIEVDFNLPESIELMQNYPNPFNPSTNISFILPNSRLVSLKVYNVLGEEIATLTAGFMEAGVHSFNFNSVGLTSGIYIYRLSTNEIIQTRKMLLMK